MSTPILGTKIHAPPHRSTAVRRPSLIEQLETGLQGRLILVSAPAGFGKTTLLIEWVAGASRPDLDLRSAWLSLDEEEGDAALFLARLVAALRTVDPDIGQQVLGMLQDPQPPPTEAILTDLINEISTLRRGIVLVLDDYHFVDSVPVDMALSFLVEHLPPTFTSSSQRGRTRIQWLVAGLLAGSVL